MSNFIETFKKGQEGLNVGLSTGIPALDIAINGIQKKMSIGIAAAAKVGKTTLADFIGLISPFLELDAKERKRLNVAKLNYWNKDRTDFYWNEDKESNFHNIEWIYFSYEIDRINKEFKFAAFFMAYDFNVHTIIHKGKVYQMSQDYLMGRLMHTNPDGTTEIVLIQEDHEKYLKDVYLNRIIPIFGEYSNEGAKLKHGLIYFIEDPENPTGLYKYLLHHASKEGKFNTEKYSITEEGRKVEKTRFISYIPKNKEKFTIVILDHIRKLPLERGWQLKQTIDKWLEYTTFLRNMCSYTFINICHSNRGVGNVERLRMFGEWIFPTGDDVKDTGNLSEESTVLLTMFNPHDEKYNLEKHFGVVLKDSPSYRSIHVVESRFTECPQHIKVNMYGGVNMFSTYGSEMS